MDQPAPKPFSYLCSKCVMQHFDVFKRLSLAARCPSLRTLHQIAPIALDRLTLGSSYYTINGYLHKFGAFNVETSQLELKITQDDDIDYDQLDLNDAYWGEDVDVGPNDVKFGRFRDGNWPPARELPEVERDEFSRVFNAFQRMLTRAQQGVDDGQNNVLRAALEPRPLYQNVFQRLQNLYPFVPEQQNVINDTPIQDLNFWAEHWGVRIAPRFSQYVRYLPGTNARDAARRHFANVLSRNTFAKNLEFRVSWGVLAIPANLKFRIRNLTIEADEFLDTVTSILEVSNPKALYITAIDEAEKSSRHPLIQAFDRLKLSPARVGHDLSPYLLELIPTEICFHHYVPPPAEVQKLARRWVKESRKIGTKLTMRSDRGYEAGRAQETLERLRQELDGEWKVLPGKLHPESPKCVTCPFDILREINIYEQPVPNYNREWVVVMEVMEMGSALAN